MCVQTVLGGSLFGEPVPPPCWSISRLPLALEAWGVAVCPRESPVLTPWPELGSPSVFLANISHRGRSDPDGKEPPGQRRVPSPGQSALCMSQGEIGWSSCLAQAGAGVTVASRPPGCQAGTSAT